MTTLLETAETHDVEDRTSAAVARLREVAASDGWGALEWSRPTPSAAFSRRDSRGPAFDAAVASVRRRGFVPFIRPVGGRLACYDEGALVLDVLLRCSHPRPGTIARFRLFAEAIAVGLRRLGVDARTGAVHGEYCPGEWSVNAGGTAKLAGTGQRLVRDAALLTAVIVVGPPEATAEAMTEAYDHLGLEFDPLSVGGVCQYVPGVALDDVEESVGGALADVLQLSAPDLVAGRALLGPWDPR